MLVISFLFFILNAGIVDTELYRDGDLYKLKLTVSTETGNYELDTDALEQDFDILGRQSSSSTSIQIINGNMKKEVKNTVYFTIRPKSGVKQVPTITVKLKSEIYKTQTINLKDAKEETATDPMRFGSLFSFGGNLFDNFGINKGDLKLNKNDIILKAIVNKDKVYLGEQLIFSVYLYKKKGLELSNISMLKEPDFKGFLKETLQTSKQLDFDTEQKIGNTVYERALLVKYVLYPIKDGNVSIETYAMNFTVGTMSFFSSPRIFKRFTKPIKIKVKPLPQNAPKGFSGAVGEFKASVSCTNTKLKVGDDTTIKFSIVGRGNFDLLDTSKFIKFPDVFTSYDSKGQLKKNSFGVAKKVFQYVLVPQQAGTFNLGPWNFTYFNTKTAKYEMQELGPIKIEVIGNTSTIQAKGQANANTVKKPVNKKVQEQDNVLKVFTPIAFLYSEYFWLSVLGVVVLVLLFLVLRKKNPRKEKLKRLNSFIERAERELSTGNKETALSLFVDVLKIFLSLVADMDFELNSYTLLELLEQAKEHLGAEYKEIKQLALDINSMRFSSRKEDEKLELIKNKLRGLVIKLKK